MPHPVLTNGELSCRQARERLLSMIAALICLTILMPLTCSRLSAEDQQSNPLRIIFYANSESNFRQFSISDSTSETPIGAAIPSTYVQAISDNDDIKYRLILSASWKDDKRYNFGVIISRFIRLPQVSIYFYRKEFTDDLQDYAKKYCRAITSSDIQTTFTRFFACSDLVQHLESKDQVGTQTYYLALRGWFYASYYLSQLGNGTVKPYELDDEVKIKIKSVLERYDSGSISKSDVDRVIDVKDVKNKIKNVEVADIFLINEVPRLRAVGLIDQAVRVNEYVTRRLPELQRVTGSSVVEGVNDKLLHNNAIDLAERASRM